MRRAVLLVGLAAALGCAPRGGPVVRVVDGSPRRGRFVSVRAYAAYARGAYLEARGKLASAEAAYREAIDADPRSPEIWTRIGAIRCRRRSRGAEAAFARAESIDAEYEPLWSERARCELARGHVATALRGAERAVRLDPDRTETSLLHARILERLGRLDTALRWLDALVARNPRSRRAWKGYLEVASRHGLTARAEQARRALGDVGAASAAPRQPIDWALAEHDLESARRLATRARWTQGELAIRAAALGVADVALEQAFLVLAADPSSGDARVAALVAADLSGDGEAFARALRDVDPDPVRPGSLGARLMADLLARRVDRPAASAWLDAYGELPRPADAVERAVAARVGR